MAFNTEYVIPSSKASFTKDIYSTNIPSTSRNVPGEIRRFDRFETEVALEGHFSDLFKHHHEKTGKYYCKITKVFIPASMSQHCNTYIAFVWLHNPIIKARSSRNSLIRDLEGIIYFSHGVAVNLTTINRWEMRYRETWSTKEGKWTDSQEGNESIKNDAVGVKQARNPSNNRKS